MIVLGRNNVKVTVEYDDDGKHYAIDATGNLKIENEKPVDFRQQYLDYFSGNTDTSTTFTVSEIESYTMTVVDHSPIERTARVLGWSDTDESLERRKPTVALIREAARKAGVDESTEYEIFYRNDRQKNTIDAYVEFRWTE